MQALSTGFITTHENANRGDPAETAAHPASGVRPTEAAKAGEILRARPVFAGPIDNHADHRAMANLVYDAWLRLGRKFALYYYEVSTGEDTVQFAPTHYVDITATEPRKRRACFAHASQSPERYYAVQEMVARMRGLESGRKLAEAFVRHVQSPEFALP